MILRIFLATVATVAIPFALLGAEPETPKSDGKAKRICEVTGVIGSRLGAVRRCRTREEWVQYRREVRESVNRYQHMRATICNGGFVKPSNQGGSTLPGGECR
jgi:hypothetical protein